MRKTIGNWLLYVGALMVLVGFITGVFGLGLMIQPLLYIAFGALVLGCLVGLAGVFVRPTV